MAKKLCLHYLDYSFPDEKTGEVRSGVSLILIDHNARETDVHSKGYKPYKQAGAFELVADLKDCEFPAILDIDFDVTAGKGGISKPVAVGVKFVEQVDFKALLKSK